MNYSSLLNMGPGCYIVHLKSSDGKTSLHCAAVTGRVRVIKELVGFFPDCIGDMTLRGETALHLAVKYNQFEAFKAMFDMLNQLNMQEILNAGDEDGNTVLHLAVARNQSQVRKYIMLSHSTRDVVFNKHFHNALMLLLIRQERKKNI
jgi:ankyrin repeat protein